MKIKLHSMYDCKSFTYGRIPKYIKWDKNDGDIDCYVDVHVLDKRDKNKKNSIALLIEPRSIQPAIYEFIESNYMRFNYVFTHDNILLSSIPNAKRILFGGVYEYHVEPKVKDISMVSSNKNMCPLHNRRMVIARKLKDIIDCYGTFDGGKWATTYDIYAPYKFSVVIENYRDDYWFTEKICNCFANKTIPIYFGAKKIDEFFNPMGIIQVQDVEDIPEIIQDLNVNKTYTEKAFAVDENYNLVTRFECFEDWFWLEYKKLLEGIK